MPVRRADVGFRPIIRPQPRHDSRPDALLPCQAQPRLAQVGISTRPGSERAGAFRIALQDTNENVSGTVLENENWEIIEMTG